MLTKLANWKHLAKISNFANAKTVQAHPIRGTVHAIFRIQAKTVYRLRASPEGTNHEKVKISKCVDSAESVDT